MHLNAREYDPTLGRFISVDPVMDLTDPQQWHAYAYSHNSPVTFSDPSGLIDTCDNDGNATCPSPGPPPGEPDEDRGGRPGGSGSQGGRGSSTCAIIIECEPLPGGLNWDPPGGGGGPWAQHIPYILEMARKAGLDPSLLLANFIIESFRCMQAGDGICRAMQAFQKDMTSPWWYGVAFLSPIAIVIPLAGSLGGQGDQASIGYANLEKRIFEATQTRIRE